MVNQVIMKQKTPMQKHIEDLQQARQIIFSLGGLTSATSAMDSAIDNAKHYLKDEKQVIVDAHLDGQSLVICKPEYAELYFNETFNQLSNEQ